MPATITRIAGRPVLPLPNWPADETLAAFAVANHYDIGGGDALRAFKPLRYGNNEQRSRRLWRIIDRPDVLTALVARGGHGNAGLQRKAVAVITHTLGALRPSDIPLGIVCDELPLSWLGCGHAYLLRSEPWTRKQELALCKNNHRHDHGTPVMDEHASARNRNAPIAATIEKLTRAAEDKDRRAGFGPCGSPAYPARHADISQIDSAARAAIEAPVSFWRRVYADVRQRARARIAEIAATPCMALAELEAQEEALAQQCIAEEYPNALPLEDTR